VTESSVGRTVATYQFKVAGTCRGVLLREPIFDCSCSHMYSSGRL